MERDEDKTTMKANAKEGKLTIDFPVTLNATMPKVIPNTIIWTNNLGRVRFGVYSKNPTGSIRNPINCIVVTNNST